MKKLVLLTALAGLFLIGCQDSRDSGITGPDNSVVAPSSNSVSFLKLPASLEPKPMHKKLQFEVTPNSGGVIHYDYSYASAEGKVSLDVQLRFPPGAVDETMIVSVDVSTDELTGDLSLDFGPSPTTFNLPALLTFTAAGLPSSDLPSDPNTLTFVYKDANGVYVPMSAKKISVDLNKGELKVQEGEVPHFSRYGWAT